ncbi:MAG: SAM-dependent methyltransferase, partial [Clostridiales bacterium]|nr:SAM-dependent methyltransferase [Clostridiales bacterium]
MRKQDYQTLKMMLSGLVSRYNENSEYLTGLRMTFKSGRKTFEAKAKPAEGSTLDLFYNGSTKNIGISESIPFFISESMKYEASEYEYIERGVTYIITADDRGVRLRQQKSKQIIETSPIASNREYILKQDKAAPLLKAIGILTKNGKLKNDMIRKYNQIDHFIELIRPMLEECGDDTITVLDCACGKSYLSFAVNFLLRDIMRRKCRIIGVDISEEVIEASKRTAEELGYRNMEFICSDLRDYKTDKPSMVISLHACDIATDMALGLAVRSKAKNIICVPCCHKELIGKYEFNEISPLMKHGIFKTRFNDVF